MDPGVTDTRDLVRPSTPLSSKRRMGDAVSPDPTSPGPKCLAQHPSVSDPPKGQSMAMDELTFEVHKLFLQ